MRILFVSPFFHPHSGGAEKYAEELFSKLVESHPDSTVDILCYNTESVETEEMFKGLHVIRIPAFNLVKKQFYLPNPFTLIVKLFQLRRNHYDLVGTQTRFFDATWWTWIYAKFVGATSFFIGHGTGPVSHSSLVVRWMASLVDLSIAKLALRFYQKIIVISQSTGEFYAGSLGVSSTELIYGGVDTKLLASTAKDKTHRIIPGTDVSVSDDSILITYLGRLIWAKGLRELVDAFAKIQKKENRVHMKLIIAGEGEYRKTLQEKIIAEKLEDSVIFTGNLGYPQAIELFKMTNIFVHPSYNEGLPRVVLEAAAAGNGVIASDVGSTNEIIIDMETGILVPPQNVEALETAIENLIDNPNLIDSLGGNAVSHVRETFDWSVIIAQFYKYIKPD